MFSFRLFSFFLPRDFIINISWAYFWCFYFLFLLYLPFHRHTKKIEKKKWKKIAEKNFILFFSEIIFPADDKEANDASTCGKILIFLSWVMVFLTMPFSLLVCFKVSKTTEIDLYPTCPDQSVNKISLNWFRSGYDFVPFYVSNEGNKMFRSDAGGGIKCRP